MRATSIRCVTVALLLLSVFASTVLAGEGENVLHAAWQKHFCAAPATVAEKAMAKADKVLAELKAEVEQDGYEYQYWTSPEYKLRFQWRKLKSRREWMQFLCLGKWRTYRPGMFKWHPREPNMVGVELEGRWVYFVVEDANYNPVQYQEQYQMQPMQYYMPASMPVQRRTVFRAAAACPS